MTRSPSQLYKTLRAKDSLTFFDLVNDAFDVANEHLKTKGSRLLALAFRAQYSDTVSNSHSAPLNGETNWGGKKKDVPRSYPGFHGRIWMAVPRGTKEIDRYNTDITSIMNQMRIFTGTGGYGNYDSPFVANMLSWKGHRLFWHDIFERVDMYSYDFRIYLDDFSSIKMGTVLGREDYHEVHETTEKVDPDFRQLIALAEEKHDGQRNQNQTVEIPPGLCGSNKDSRYIHSSVPKQNSQT